MEEIAGHGEDKRTRRRGEYQMSDKRLRSFRKRKKCVTRVGGTVIGQAHYYRHCFPVFTRCNAVRTSTLVFLGGFSAHFQHYVTQI